MAAENKANAKLGGGRKRPKLGQNFLSDQGAAARTVAALGDISRRTIIEIGPGQGSLTGLLAGKAGHFIAIELDRVLATQLRMKYSRVQNVEIVEGDVLAFDFATLIGGSLRGLRDLQTSGEKPKASVIGNLPYFITSDILLRLFGFHESIDMIVIMVQKEVADRIAAKPGTSDYGLLSATAQLFARVEKLFTLGPASFTPPPKVHSTVIKLVMAPQVKDLGVEPGLFLQYLRGTFAQKRKTLHNNLKAEFADEKIKAAIKAAKVRPDARAEALTLQQAAAVYRALRDG